MKSQIKKTGRNYRLEIPSIIRVGLGWQNDKVDLIPNPDKNELIIRNLDKSPASFIGFFLNIDNARWIKNKKQYQKSLKKQMTNDAKNILHAPNIWIDEYNNKILLHNEILNELKKCKSKKYLNSKIEETNSIIKQLKKELSGEIRKKALDSKKDNKQKSFYPKRKKIVRKKLSKEERIDVEKDLEKMKKRKQDFKDASEKGLNKIDENIKNIEETLKSGTIRKFV